MSYMIGKIEVIVMKMSSGDSSKKRMLTNQRVKNNLYRIFREPQGGFDREFSCDGSSLLKAVRQHFNTARVTSSGGSTSMHDWTREEASGGS
ncbi:hypothetical protein [Halovenus amylolytica]|uniref:hypothetical protein n=1 Tax=Halovenus amylolytica TaxID=2500550 RepID=UPI003D6B7466